VTDRFVRELLLGIDEVKPADRRAIAAYLTDVVVQRGFPLHVGSLWNALYFEWDLHEHGYLAPGLNPDRVRETSFGATSEAVPVGGFVRLAAGEAEIWAEVVYKEGRHPDIGPDGVVPPRVSGAKAEIGGEPPHAEIREALILDFEAFGPAWNDLVDIARFERKGRLDEFGHVVMTGCYDEREAELDDAAYYARYLLRHHRDGLLAEFVEPGASDEELSGALLVSLATIAEIARGAAGLATFNGYFFPAADFAARTVDVGSENPVGADFFLAVYHALAVCPRGQTVDYAATGQRIRGYLERGGGLDEAERALITGPGWSRLVLYANHYVARRVQNLPDGIEGSFAEGRFHLRRDDAWQAGGIWRTERVNGQVPDIARIPPLIALGLGADEASRVEGGTAFVASPPPLAPMTVDASSRSWTVTLSAADIDRGSLRIGDARWVMPHGDSQLRFKLGDASRPGAYLRNALVAYNGRDRALSGIAWGFEVFQGVRLFCEAQDRGMTVRAYLHRLVPAETVDGQRLEFEYDPAYFGLARRRRPLGAGELRGIHSFRDLIARAFRERGEALADGARRLTATELAAVTVGLDAEPATIALVLRTVGEMDVDDNGTGSLTWHPVVTARTRAGDRTLIGEAGRRAAAVAHRWLRPHVVRMHLRRAKPSPAKVAGYAAGLREYGAWGRLAADLPTGRTWVKEYEAGGKTFVD
jgi:hypothetical protein